MDIVVDQRSSQDLSDSEIVAYLFQAIRVRQLRTAKQVQDLCKGLFPDLSDDRTRDCLLQLAQAMDHR